MNDQGPAPQVRPELHRIPMRDGVRLAADVYLPNRQEAGASAERWPALLGMTPYGKGQFGPYVAAAALPRGYAVVMVDVRGRYDSEGTFEPIAQERVDGPDVLGWLGRQPWLDARAGVGIIGASYLSTAGFLAAAGNPLVRAMTCCTVVIDPVGGMFRGGALNLHHALPWCVITSASPQPSLKGWDWPALFRHLPLATMDRQAGLDLQTWHSLVVGSHDDSGRGPELDISDAMRGCLAPVLHLAGWYDLLLGDSLRAHRILVESNRAPQHLVLGPWSHTTLLSGETRLGDFDFGPQSSSRMLERTLAWFDYWLRGQGERLPAVSAFVTGGGGWRHSPAWPPADARQLRLYLTAETAAGLPEAHSGALALSEDTGPASGSGASGGATRTVGFLYDPADPTPTIGGSVWPFPIAGLVPGPADQRPLLGRQDGCFFLTPPLAADLIALGPARVHLRASTDAPDTDFCARIIDVEPDGAWRVIQDGVQCLSALPGAPPGTAAGPGTEFDIDCWAVGHRFARGHRAGLHLSSANFPKYDRNLNTGHDRFRGVETRPARQTIWTSPSYLSLMVPT